MSMTHEEASVILHEQGSRCLGQFATVLTPGFRLTLLARNPDHPDGSRDVLITNDGGDEICAAVRQLLAQASETR